MNPEGCAYLRPAPWRGAARQCAAGKCLTCCADCSQREGYESKARNAVTGQPYRVAPCASPMLCRGPRGAEAGDARPVAKAPGSGAGEEAGKATGNGSPGQAGPGKG